MTDIEPIITSWLVSPIGLLITAIVIIAIIAISTARIMTSFPSKE